MRCPIIKLSKPLRIVLRSKFSLVTLALSKIVCFWISVCKLKLINPSASSSSYVSKILTNQLIMSEYLLKININSTAIPFLIQHSSDL